MNQAQVLTDANAGIRTKSLPAVLMACMGLFFLWGVGFSPMDALHNAAHDTRHINIFPCH